MFVDLAEIKIKAGNGGNGAVSFHRSKDTPWGGPDGGNGGKGGDVIFVADSNMSTLAEFKNRNKFFAPNGQNGSSKKSSGKSGEDLIIKVPCGTIIKDIDSGRIMHDLCKPGEMFVAALGGKGGVGNFNLKSSIDRAPKRAKEGEPGESFNICLELKLLADVGLVGMPNAGKSTIISTISNAKPKIANYPFTTLSPVLGVVNHYGKSCVVADIPGLIEGASKGIGLGHEFLKHIQRCKILVHVVDVSQKNCVKNFETVSNELTKFDKKFAKIPMFVLANKIDISPEENISKFEKYLKNKKIDFLKISASKGISGLGVFLDELFGIIGTVKNST